MVQSHAGRGVMKVRIETRGASYTAELTMTRKSVRSAARSAKNALKSIIALGVEKPEVTEEAPSKPDKGEKTPTKRTSTKTKK